MWETKIFKTKESFNKWVDTQGHKCQWVEIFINNAYGVDYRKLKRVY
jgi:hypothetical protein